MVFPAFKYLLILLVFICQLSPSLSTSYIVGQGETYPTPNALYNAQVLAAGDTILINAEDYNGTDAVAVWLEDDLVIKGVGGTPHLIADGAYIWGKGIWVLFGNNITVENFEFSGASVPDNNGAGIRLDGSGMTIRHCYFHNNENGILTSSPYSGDILIEYTEFAYNGFGDGQSHNLYINHVNKLTFRYNYSHHANIGHNLKSRAAENIIVYNRIMDEATGNSSRLIDLSNGGKSTIMGNILMQGPVAENNNLIGYGLEGLTKPVNELYVYNNSMVNKRTASCIFVAIQTQTPVAEVVNNIFAGTGTIINGNTTVYGNNTINQLISAVGFTNESSYDYTLLSSSPAIDTGTSSITSQPTNVYVHPLQSEIRTTSNVIIDTGAFEYDQGTDVTVPLKADISIENGDILIEDNQHGIVLKSVDGKCFRLVVDPSGGLSTVLINCQ